MTPLIQRRTVVIWPKLARISTKCFAWAVVSTSVVLVHYLTWTPVAKARQYLVHKPFSEPPSLDSACSWPRTSKSRKKCDVNTCKGSADGASNRADLEVDVGQLWRMCMINPLWASLILQASLPARPAPVRVLATGTAARRWKPCASQAAFFHQNIPRPQPERGAINWRCRCETRLCQC